ncbi:MAG: SapC family protein [Nevskia sp.]|nr:SapC family protein [Gammaproteobacteria bacterium]MDH4457775.1 SapC family protein [Nevskia sp.]
MSEAVPAAASAAAADTRLPLFFKRIEALDSLLHRNLKLKSRASHAFARGSNAIPLTFSEIPLASQEYPIVFAGEGDRLHIVALVGLTNADNLFIDDDGHWQGRYVPAFVRCYPFALGQANNAADDQFLLAFDPDADTVSETEGAALFDDTGARTVTLERMVQFLSLYQAQMDLARQFARKVAELDLLVAVDANIRTNNGAQYALSGLRVVERDALQRLPDAAKLELFGSEWLEMIHHHFASLRTLPALVDRLSARGEVAAVAA